MVAVPRCALVTPTGKPELDCGLQVTVGCAVQLSCAVAEKVTGTCQSMLQGSAMSAGQLMVGASLSTTVTRCTQVAVLPEVSVAVQVTEVVPLGKTVGASLATLARPQLSAAVAVPKLTLAAEHWPGSVLTVTSGGHEIVGGSVSLTVTVNEQEAVLPAASVAVQATVVVPFGKVEPEGGAQTTATPGWLSSAVTV
jgi:hypothetical protein